jgi:hypothetical protein
MAVVINWEQRKALAEAKAAAAAAEKEAVAKLQTTYKDPVAIEASKLYGKEVGSRQVPAYVNDEDGPRQVGTKAEYYYTDTGKAIPSKDGGKITQAKSIAAGNAIPQLISELIGQPVEARKVGNSTQYYNKTTGKPVGPQYESIASGLTNNGIYTTSIIGQRELPVDQDGNQEKEFYNRYTGQKINPRNIGIILNGTAGLSGGDMYFDLKSDGKGNISFAPRWSPRSHGFLRDSAIGQAIMALGSIIPSPLQPAFVAAGVVDSLAHGNIAGAVVKALPFGMQALTEGTNLLTDIAGPDFNPLASTPSGMVAEALGVPGQVADAVGKATTSMVSAGITGQDVGDALIKSGITSLVGAGAEGLKDVGKEALDGIKGGLSSLANDVSSGASELADTASSKLSNIIDNVTSDVNTNNVSSIGMTGLPSGLPSDLTQGADLSRLSEDELNNLYGTTVANAVDPSLNSTTLSNVSAAVDPTKTVDLSNLSNDELNSLYGGATISTNAIGALTTSEAAANATSQINEFTPAQINALTNVGTGLIVGSLLTGSSTKPTTTLSTDTVKALSTDMVKALSTDTTAALTTDKVAALSTDTTTALTTDKVAALTTMDALGLQGIANPTLRYWNQTGAAGTAGQGGVRFFDWSTNPVPVMGGSNIAAAQALSSVPMLTSSQIAALNPTPVQYYNQATNRYYSDPTGKWQPPAGWTRTGLKGGGEVKTKHFDGTDGSDVNIFDFGAGLDFNNTDWDTVIPAGSGYTDDNSVLNDLRWESGYFGTPEEVAQNYGNEGSAYTGENALDPTTSSPVNAGSSTVVKNVVDKLKGLGAKLGASALKSIENNPGAWLAALAGAGLGYAASKNNTVTPMGLRGLGLSQQQVYNTLKGGNYVGKAVGGEIPGYGMGGGLHYLKSAEDGMADKIPATIDNKQPARLSGGEFVIPADVVSHLGNGNSEAGAKQLYEMMDRIRHARTGTKEQGKQINPSKFTPK